jgi:hypothetical protein
LFSNLSIFSLCFFVVLSFFIISKAFDLGDTTCGELTTYFNTAVADGGYGIPNSEKGFGTNAWCDSTTTLGGQEFTIAFSFASFWGKCCNWKTNCDGLGEKLSLYLSLSLSLPLFLYRYHMTLS